MSITFYDLLGVSEEAIPRDAAAVKWPAHLVQASTGIRDQPDLSETVLLMDMLQGALSFSNVRPGADADRVGLTAELLVSVAPTMPLVLAALPDIEFHLLPTTSNPARVIVTQGDLGVELIVEALPVEIRFPPGYLKPLEPEGSTDPVPPVEDINSFASGRHDTITVTLNSLGSSVIRVHLKVRMTEDGRFVIEPAVPLSIGPCRLLGLPCRAVHDLNLFPAPRLGVRIGDEDYYGNQALEWVRHPLLDEDETEFGLLTVRTLDLDDTRVPLRYLREEINSGNPDESRFEWVVEDLAIPIGTGPFPVPSHFLVGLRRQLGPGDDPAGAYNLGGLAVPLKGAARLLHFKYLIIEQLLLRSVPSPDVAATEGDRQFAFLKLALVNDPTGAGNGATIDLTDEWTVLAGWRHQPGIDMFKLFGATFRLLGARIGLSLQRMSKGESVFGSGLLLADLEVSLAKKDQPAQSKPGVVALEGESDEPKGVVIHDFGLRFGGFSVGSFWQTGGAKLKAFDIIRLEIEEFGLITEPSGAVYFGFSGSIPLPAGAEAGKPVSSAETAGSAGKVENGVGFRFYKLRGKVAGAEEAPFLLIDGIGLSVRYGKFGITGFGMISEFTQGSHRFKECGISVEVRFPVGDDEIILGGLFFHGTVRGPEHNFTYWMIGLHVSPIPLGPITLRNVRLLFAWNMTPNLGTLDPGAAPTMRLFEWYKANSNALALPSNRNLGAGGWRPEAESYTIAAAAEVAIGTRVVTINAFFLYLKSASSTALLAGFEIFLFASKKPIGYAVLEIEGDRWSLMAGISIGLANVIGRQVPFLNDVPFLSGTFYHTNKPATTAIGQFQDPSTWLAVHIGGGSGKKFSLFTIELFAGMCIQDVDLPGGPHVFALRNSVTGGSRLFKVGGLDFYLTLELIAGIWRTESKVSGYIVYFEGGLNVDVFWVFNWGASVRVECDYLGPDPSFRRFSVKVKINTPWWLPDVTFSWTTTTGSPAVEMMRVLATPVIEAAAKQLSAAEAVPMPALSPVVGAQIDPAAVYSFNELAPAAGVIPPESIAQIVPISVDSSISLHFKPSLDDRLVFGQNTVPGMGSDTSRDLSTVYELVELGIRRRPRTSSVWSTLIEAAESRMESLVGLPPEVVEQRVRPKVRLRWDADFQREGKPAPRRLLINTDAPYWFTVVSFEADEMLVQNTPGWPCCIEGRKPKWHILNFLGVIAGTRVPATQAFSESTSTLRWTGILPPIAGPGQVAAGVPSVARLNGDTTPLGVFARIAFFETAHSFELKVRWKPMHLHRKLLVRAFRGLQEIEQKSFVLSENSPNFISMTSAEGISEILLSLSDPPIDAQQQERGFIEFVEMRFRSIEEELIDVLEDARCQAAQDSHGQPGGRFAWLPNHEYEISFRTRIKTRHERIGELIQEVPQRLLFRTKGLPGLNQAERVGEEFEPYVESAYPGPGRLLYRSEPVALALNERSDIFRLPETPSPDDPLERRQQVDWVMVVSRVGGSGPAERISRPASDWIVAHRGTVTTPPPTGHLPVDVVTVAEVGLRRAMSLDPLWQRFEAVLSSPFSCDQSPSPPLSRVLIHRPYDPAEPDATPPTWPPRAVLRAGTQIRGGPYVERTPFEAGDETSLLTTGGFAWKVENGATGPASDTGTITSLAIFGEKTWQNVHIYATVNPRGGSAGVAAAVRGTSPKSRLLLFVIDESTRRLQVIRRKPGSETEIAGTALPADLPAPFALEVTAYDDAWHAAVGTAQVKIPRDLADSGRLALAVRGSGHILDLRVDPLDIYRFEFLTSRYVDFAAHIASWSGAVAVLPEVAPPGSTLGDLFAATPLDVLMRANSDPQQRQNAFNQWTRTLAVSLRREVERLEVSARATPNGCDLLLIESPEALPFSEDVSITMTRVLGGGVRIPIPLAILSDGAELRAYLLPLSNFGVPVELAHGEYEINWSISRDRYRTNVSDADSHFSQQTTMTLHL